ncbi:MAG: CocE/NonD family hydrolase [Actinomycetota bacterium]
MQRRLPALLLAAILIAAACSSASDDAASTTTPSTGGSTATTAAPTTAAPSTALATTEPATTSTLPTIELDATLQPGVEQLAITGAESGTTLAVAPAADAASPAAEGTVDEFGSLLFRGLDGAADYVIVAADGVTEPVTTLDRSTHPDPDFYADQEIEPGYGYIETRDGTTLSANVSLPGPVEDGPYPTVLEYSGYEPSDPDAVGLGALYNALGYAYVGVNMRGTGCSGGSYRFFEYAQNLDGYDALEAVAAQPWVQNNRVGMVGISYPGISQLFVAQTQPPSLAAITPLSVIDDTFDATLYPGGILNTGFATNWIQGVVDEATPEGQEWAAARIAAGDEECATNQQLRLQNPDLVAEILDTPFYDPALGDELSPAMFASEIEVPTFIAGAWQDEQTGGHFPALLDQFTGTDRLYASLVNGLHIEALTFGILPRYVEFLDLYVAQRTPTLDGARLVAPALGSAAFGVEGIELPPDRFAGLPYEEALAAFEAEPPIEVLFEQGAADGQPPLSPVPRFVRSFDAWPIPETEPTRWFLGGDGTTGGSLTAEPPVDDGRAEYLALPDGVPATFYDDGADDGDDPALSGLDIGSLYGVDVVWNWQEPAPGTFVSFATEPLDDTIVMVGSGSADLYVASNLGDTDLEVTLSEIRPDGSEIYVQSGWLRASQRALDEDASTDLRPVHTNLEADAAPLPDGADGEFALARVEIFPFAHVFRPGSQVRLSVDAPGGNRAVWEFATIGNGEQVTIATGGDTASSVVLPVIPGIDVPATAPSCTSLRGQPCR